MPLPGAFIIKLPYSQDRRGSFTKIFQDSVLRAHGISFKLEESYYSVSKMNVIRGMHFQKPPHQHAKIVFCSQGSILDVVLDLRKDSGTYGQHFATILSDTNQLAYYIPEGFAHGFKALTDNVITQYLVSSEYNKEADSGVLYNSFGMDWQCAQPILSDRDMSFESLSLFDTPF
jgi:dTDP-4-dehydrorhamnose 3,5-epimerase